MMRKILGKMTAEAHDDHKRDVFARVVLPIYRYQLYKLLKTEQFGELFQWRAGDFITEDMTQI
jgi:hypothetical protein